MQLRARGQLTLPEKVRKLARLVEGDLLEAEVTDEGVLLRPRKLIDREQAWFWTPEWQRGERAADEDLAAKRIRTFSNGDEFVRALKKISKPKRKPRKS